MVFTYPKVFFDSWIIDPVRNCSASFSVGLPRIGAESCEVMSVFEIKSHSLTVNIVEKNIKRSLSSQNIKQYCQTRFAKVAVSMSIFVEFLVKLFNFPEFSLKRRVICG